MDWIPASAGMRQIPWSELPVTVVIKNAGAGSPFIMILEAAVFAKENVVVCLPFVRIRASFVL